MMAKINRAAEPWIKLLGRITQHRRLRQIDEIDEADPREVGWWIERDIDSKKHVVYARVNIENDSMYVGETQNIEERMKCHFRLTCKHRRVTYTHVKGAESIRNTSGTRAYGRQRGGR